MFDKWLQWIPRVSLGDKGRQIYVTDACWRRKTIIIKNQDSIYLASVVLLMKWLQKKMWLVIIIKKNHQEDVLLEIWPATGRYLLNALRQRWTKESFQNVTIQTWINGFTCLKAKRRIFSLHLVNSAISRQKVRTRHIRETFLLF